MQPTIAITTQLATRIMVSYYLASKCAIAAYLHLKVLCVYTPGAFTMYFQKATAWSRVM